MSDKSKTETMNKEANRKPTREQIVSAIKARDTVVAWLMWPYALIYEPDTNEIRVCPGAGLADVQRIAAITPRKTLVVNGISGLGCAALEENKLFYICKDPEGNESPARREAIRFLSPDRWRQGENPGESRASKEHNNMINPKEDAGEKPFDIIVYHVVDKNGMHRYLTMNSRSGWFSEGRKGFERVLAKQYKTFEWLGSNPIIVSSDDPPKAQFPDPDGRDQLYDRIRALMHAFPNSSHRLEAWTPDPEERVEWAAAEHVRSPWKPMSTLKQAMGGKVDFDRIAIAFVDKDVCEMVKPEFVDIVRARGRALLREFREDVRKVLERSLLQGLEGSAEAPDRQGGPAAPDEWKAIPDWEVDGKVKTEYVSAAREKGAVLRRELKGDVRK